MARLAPSTSSRPSASPLAADASQLKFCQFRDGHVRLLAPAGCGKTQALLWRCQHLAEANPKEKPRFLIFTFTRSARDELNDRLRRDFPGIAQSVTINTLNAWGYRKLKDSHLHARLRTNHNERNADLRNVLQPVWQKYPRLQALLAEKFYRHSQAIHAHLDLLKTLAFRHDRIHGKSELAEHLDFLTQCGTLRHYEKLLDDLTDMEILRGEKDRHKAFLEHFFQFFQEACTTLRSTALFSLEDQKYWTWIDLEAQLAQRRHWSGAARYRYIMVDEFQDINPLDLQLLKTVTALNRAELTLIGDDDQAIYEWRAATPEFILKPEAFLGQSYHTFVLGINYRSPRNIVELSQELIAHNTRRVPKQVRAHRSEDAKIDVHLMNDLSASIDFVVQLVKQSQAGGDCRRVALIGRKRAQIIPYQIVFASQDIPFYAAEDLQVFLSESFDALKEMLMIRARATAPAIYATDPVEDLLKLCDRVKRWKLAKTDRDLMRAELRRARPRNLAAAVDGLRGYRSSLKGTNADGRMSHVFADAIEELLNSQTVAQAITAISQSFEGMQRDYGRSIEDIFRVDPPFLHLSDYAMRYGTDFGRFYEDLDKAIATLARIPPEDESGEPGDESFKLPLHLMTALRAKGKEFDTVVILDANDGIWPSSRAETAIDLEQERRLFYVAMTRARKRLIVLVNRRLLDKPAVASPYLVESGLYEDDEG